jgi:hypothetical protein
VLHGVKQPQKEAPFSPPQGRYLVFLSGGSSCLPYPLEAAFLSAISSFLFYVHFTHLYSLRKRELLDL